jgi:hypothetical protein
VPFGDAAATAFEIARLLTDVPAEHARALSCRHQMRLGNAVGSAERTLEVLERARLDHGTRSLSQPVQVRPLWVSEAPPEIRIDHFLSMCDDTGLLQHAVHSVPDRQHGYCVDDNARALLLACALNHHCERPCLKC